MTKELQSRLASLHQELARTQAVDAESRQMLLELLGEITRLLGQPGELSPQHSLGERLNALAVDFEAEHPALSHAIRQVVDTLGKAGI
ncbi:MAG TPA: DUF4404 family protein [Steroidobacteraceae bacterium]